MKEVKKSESMTMEQPKQWRCLAPFNFLPPNMVSAEAEDIESKRTVVVIMGECPCPHNTIPKQTTVKKSR
jgi:hypothetical protein